MTNNAEENSFNNFEKSYRIVALHQLSAGSKRMILGGKEFVCRFCGKGKPEAKFKKAAHALPHLIGNNSLFTHYECDECNQHFGNTIERHYAAFMHLDHTFSGIAGKNGIPKFKAKNANIESTGSFIDWKEVPPENMQLDQKKGKVIITQQIPTFVPVAVYKCLVKMALTILPEQYFIGFNNTIKWLKEEEHSQTSFPFTKLSILTGTSTTRTQFKEITAVMAMHKEELNYEIPKFVFRLTYGNFLFSLPIPLHLDDKMTNWTTIPYLPTTIDLELGFETTTYHMIDFSYREPAYGLEKTFTIQDLDGRGIYEEVDA
ncbi:MAG: hypothetical protein EOO01_00165 [Chitinophagaceae bacterium]|nr:MAG: hypothetical protein EOO01_00165 [Chitinophagaceae bacterium]